MGAMPTSSFANVSFVALAKEEATEDRVPIVPTPQQTPGAEE